MENEELENQTEEGKETEGTGNVDTRNYKRNRGKTRRNT